MAKKTLTVADVKNFKQGVTKLKVVRNGGGHNYMVGKVYVFNTTSGNSVTLTDPENKCTGNWANFGDVELVATRAEEADMLQEEVDNMTKKIVEMTDQIARLRKYKDDNDELAHLISETIKSDGSPASIYTLLTKFKVAI